MHLLSFPGRPNLAQRQYHPPKIVPPRSTTQSTTRTRTRRKSIKNNATTRHTRTTAHNTMVIAHHRITTIIRTTTIEAITTTVEPITIPPPVAVGNLITAAVATVTEVTTPALPKLETSRPVLLLLTKTNTRKSQLPGKTFCSRRATCPDQRSTYRRPRTDYWRPPTVPHRRRPRQLMEVTSPRAAGVFRRRNRSRRIRPT